MDDALDLALAAGDHRYDETLVADGDELFLQQVLLAVQAEEALQGVLDQLPLPLDVAAQAGQFRAGVIGHRPVGQKLPGQFPRQRSEITDSLGADRQSREPCAHRGQHQAHARSDVEQLREFTDFFGLQATSFDTQFGQGFEGVWQRVKPQADGGAACRRLRPRGRLHIFDRLAGLRQIFFERGTVDRGDDLIESLVAHGAGDVAPDQRLQRVKLQQCGARNLHAAPRPSRNFFRNALRITAKVPSVIWRRPRSSRRTHSTRSASPPGRSTPPATRHR